MKLINRRLLMFFIAIIGGLCIQNEANAQNKKSVQKHGYDIKVEFKQPVKDGQIVLAKYFGTGYPQVYKVADAEVKNGTSAHFKSTDSILGGFYLILFNENQQFFELILDDGDAMTVMVDTIDFPKKIAFKNSPENEAYVSYINEVSRVAKLQTALQESLENAKNKEDSTKVTNQMKVHSNEINAYRNKHIQNHPNHFLSQVFKALIPIDIPEGIHYLEDGTTVDSTYAYRYYKKHFWDGFNFQDERLIHSPILENKLEEYFTKVVTPFPDSIIAEADALLAKPDQNKELFKYTLHHITKFAESSKIMGMDEVFVYMVENYHMQGKAYWMDEELVEKFATRARQIAPNVIGKQAFNMKVNDAFSLKEQSLHDFDSDQTILIFWNPTCSACLKEVPKLKKLHEEELKAKGVKVFSVLFGGDLELIQKQIIESKVEGWNNFVITKDIHEIQENFDAYDTPKIYFLGKDFNIEGKRLSSENMMNFYEIFQRKNKE